LEAVDTETPASLATSASFALRSGPGSAIGWLCRGSTSSLFSDASYGVPVSLDGDPRPPYGVRKPFLVGFWTEGPAACFVASGSAKFMEGRFRATVSVAHAAAVPTT